MDARQARRRVDDLRDRVIGGGHLSTQERTFLGNLLDFYGRGLEDLYRLTGSADYVGPYGSGGGGIGS